MRNGRLCLCPCFHIRQSPFTSISRCSTPKVDPGAFYVEDWAGLQISPFPLSDSTSRPAFRVSICLAPSMSALVRLAEFTSISKYDIRRVICPTK